MYLYIDTWYINFIYSTERHTHTSVWPHLTIIMHASSIYILHVSIYLHIQYGLSMYMYLLISPSICLLLIDLSIYASFYMYYITFNIYSTIIFIYPTADLTVSIHQCHISETSVPHQWDISETSVQPEWDISASSVRHQWHISETSVRHQCHISASSVTHQCLISDTSVTYQWHINAPSVTHQWQISDILVPQSSININ